MKHIERKIMGLSLVIATITALAIPASAMHVMEGMLPVTHCILWGVLCLPFLIFGIIKIRKIVDNDRKSLLILAMAGAYTFLLSALKIPSVSGSSSHPTGTGLGAVLFGPTPMAVLGAIVLLFQALLLAHGGLTTLGANIFSMAIVGPFVAYGIYVLCKKVSVNRKVAIFLAAALGDLLTYCVTSFQLAVAYPSATGGFADSFVQFLSIFAVTQIPLAVVEGLLTVAVVIGLESLAKSELKVLGYFGGVNA